MLKVRKCIRDVQVKKIDQCFDGVCVVCCGRASTGLGLSRDDSSELEPRLGPDWSVRGRLTAG